MMMTELSYIAKYDKAGLEPTRNIQDISHRLPARQPLKIPLYYCAVRRVLTNNLNLTNQTACPNPLT